MANAWTAIILGNVRPVLLPVGIGHQIVDENAVNNNCENSRDINSKAEH